ncbi:hypothetical protein FKP32DRAFT_1588406 [Trametes sanguinea]|nr:hypothetical protein FKP32DRAFT_1588406 [Trametes sanguinea]
MDPSYSVRAGSSSLSTLLSAGVASERTRGSRGLATAARVRQRRQAPAHGRRVGSAGLSDGLEAEDAETRAAAAGEARGTKKARTNGRRACRWRYEDRRAQCRWGQRLCGVEKRSEALYVG